MFDLKMSHYNIEDGSTLHLVLRLRGQGDLVKNHIVALNIGELAIFEGNHMCNQLPIAAVNSTFTITFDTPEYQSCSVKLTKLKNETEDDDEEVEGVTTRDEASHTVLFTPNNKLSYDSEYMLEVRSSANGVLSHTTRFKTSQPLPVALVLCTEGQRYPVVVEDFDNTSAGGLNNLKNKAKELLGGLQDKPCSQLRLTVVLLSGEAPLNDDESVQALKNHDRIMVMFDGDESAGSGSAAVGSLKRGRSSLEGEA